MSYTNKTKWIDEEKLLVNNNVSVGARINISDLKFNKHLSINELRWRLYQELIRNIGEHPSVEGAFYVRTWVDEDTNTGNVYLLGRIESIQITNTIVKAIIDKPEYNCGKKLSFKDRLKILFRGEL